jgi:hypothetical protein
VRLSPARLLLRSGLLFLGGGFMLWRAWEARAVARLVPGPERVLGERIALVEALVGALAVVTGAAALLSLRRRERRHSLHLPPGARPPLHPGAEGPGVPRPGATEPVAGGPAAGGPVAGGPAAGGRGSGIPGPGDRGGSPAA